jgi:hypothetical protein
MTIGINNIMKKLYYLNYFIYKFYEKRDPDPFIYSFFGSSLLVSLNLLSIIILLQDFIGFQFYKYYSIFILIILFGINYFSLYKNSKYKEIFISMTQENNQNRNFIFFLIYLFFTIALILIIIAYVRVEKFGVL